MLAFALIGVACVVAAHALLVSAPRRDGSPDDHTRILVVLGTLVVAVGLSAVLFVGSAATSPGEAVEASARPRVFFDQRNTLPAARTVVDAQRRVAGPLQAIVPLQRGISDAARDARACC